MTKVQYYNVPKKRYPIETSNLYTHWQQSQWYFKYRYFFKCRLYE